MSEKQDFGIRGSNSFHFPSAASPTPHPIIPTLTPFLKQLWFYFLCTICRSVTWWHLLRTLSTFSDVIPAAEPPYRAPHYLNVNCPCQMTALGKLIRPWVLWTISRLPPPAYLQRAGGDRGEAQEHYSCPPIL